MLSQITDYLQRWSGCDAVGVRLKEGEDFPYCETRGFPAEFVEAERYLCERDLHGQLVRDVMGHPLLECMCGNALCGRSDPEQPFFTTRGSFCSNNTSALLATTSKLSDWQRPATAVTAMVMNPSP